MQKLSVYNKEKYANKAFSKAQGQMKDPRQQAQMQARLKAMQQGGGMPGMPQMPAGMDIGKMMQMMGGGGGGGGMPNLGGLDMQKMMQMMGGMGGGGRR